MVSVDLWSLSATIPAHRRKRLLEPRPPGELLERLEIEAKAAADGRLVSAAWIRSDEAPAFWRIEAQIPVTQAVFDQWFNSRSGYRAQYYLSPDEGIAFNRQTVEKMIPAVRAGYAECRLAEPWSLVAESLAGPFAKAWVYKDKEAFDSAIADTLTPPQWVENKGSRGLCAPLPTSPSIEIKGTFIDPASHEVWVDPIKVSRACDLHLRGFS